MATAIEFENVGKQYRLGLVSTQTLSHDLHRWWTVNVRHKEDPYLKIGETNDRASKGNSDYVWALRDINFKVEQGDVVGIIGRNGAGKSTLLKLLSKVTGPTTGTIRARGRIGSLLEVGTGFHPEMTGRENIYMNGAILGMTKAEVTRKLDEIVDFSGCERYLDTPVKRYSSGMMVRLGFAVAAHLDPEILVVDEVLAVGDAEFQKKAIGKMKDVSQGEGRTVLFVSHNMASIRALCNNGILLNHGQVEYSGSVEDTIDKYMSQNIPECVGSSLTNFPRDAKCTGNIQYTGVRFINDSGNVVSPHCGRPLKIEVSYNVKEPGFTGCSLSVGIADMYGNPRMSFPTKFTLEKFELKPGSHKSYINIPKLPLTAGSYRLGLWAEINNECADYLDGRIRMDVEDDDFFSCGRTIDAHLSGKVVLCEHEWTI